jgi:hypothetical protein
LKEKKKRRLAIGLLTIDKERREVKLGSRMFDTDSEFQTHDP